MRKTTIFLLSLALLLVAGLFSVRPIMYGNARPVSISAADPLTGQISQALASSSNGQLVLPVSGQDYTLSGITYFDNHTWAFAAIKPLSNSMNSSNVVLEKQSGVYKVVLGPGSAFPRTTTLTMPADIAQFLNQRGLLYDALD